MDNYQKITKAEIAMLHALGKQGLDEKESVACCLFLLADSMAMSKPRYENADRDTLFDSIEMVLNHIEMRRTQVKILNILKQQNN